MPTTTTSASADAMLNDTIPTIAERVERGDQAQSAEGGAIVPMPEKSSLIAVPIPDALTGRQAGAVRALLMSGFREKARHVYRARSGQQIMAVLRYEKGSAKEFRPLCYHGCNKDGFGIYDLRAVDSLRPLYNLDQIASRPTETLLFVEGEKAADAAALAHPEYIATTWPCGANSTSKVDLRDAASRNAILWPDNDKAGVDAMHKLAAGLLAVGCTVFIVAVPDSYPPKWDVADAVPDGIADNERPAELLAAAKPIDPATAAAMLAAAAPKVTAAHAAGKTAGGNEDMHRFFSAARYLGTTGKRNYACGGGYGDWLDLMCAAKNGYSDAAFAEFSALSAEYGGTDTDEKLRSKWDSLEPRPEGERKMPATFFGEALEAGWTDPSAGGSDGGRAGRSDPASVVLEQSAEAGDILWCDQHGRPHASMRMEDSDGVARTIHVRIGGKRHKGAVSRRYRLAHKNRVLSAEQEKRAMLLLEHEATECGAMHESANRVAAHDGRVYVDLGRADGKVICVSADGWTVDDQAPVRFVRGSRGELPVPLAGGTLDDFQLHFNLAPRDVRRTVGFIIGVLAPIGSFPILLIEGRQGTAKSTLGDFVLALCDPPHTFKGGRISMPRGITALMVHASGVRVPFIDNLSDLSDAEADGMCILSTGGGTSARQLYSDDAEASVNAVRPAIVTAIGTPSPRGDFLDRCLRVTALPIQHRRTEEAVYTAFAHDRPRMFGFVLDALATSLRNMADVAARAEAGELRLARMADFGLYVEAAAPALGMEPGEFSKELLDEQAVMQADGALGSPLGDALARYFSAARHERKELAGPATEVLDELRPLLPDPTGLPASNKLKGALRRIEPGLNDLGMVATITEPSMGTRNRKTHYRIATTDAFQPIGEELPF
jgi:hypothetical protein